MTELKAYKEKYFFCRACMCVWIFMVAYHLGFSQFSLTKEFIDLEKIEAFVLGENGDACKAYLSQIAEKNQIEFSHEESALFALAKCKCGFSDEKLNMSKDCERLETLAKDVDRNTEEGLSIYVEIQMFLAERERHENALDNAITRIESLVPQVAANPTTNIRVLLKLAVLYEWRFEYDKTMQFLGKAELLAQSIETLDYHLKHELYNRYAGVYSKIDELEKMKEFIDTNLALIESQDTIDNFHLGNVHYSLASYYFRNADHVKSLYHFEREFEYKSKVVHENKLSDCMMNIANISSKIGEFDKAIEFAQRSLDIIQHKHGLNSDRVAHNNFVTGLIFLEQGKHAQALQCFKKSLDIESNLYGESHKGMSFNYIRLADCYYGLNNFEKAIYYCQKAIAGFKKHFGEKNQQVSWAYETLIESAILDENYRLARKSIDEAYVSLSLELDRSKMAYESILMPFLALHILIQDIELSLIEYKENQSKTRLAYLNKLEHTAYGLYNHLKLNMGEGTMHRLLSLRLAGITQDIIAKNDFLYETTGDTKYLDEILKGIEKGRNNILFETKVENELVEFSGVPNALMQQQVDLKDSIASLTLELSSLPIDKEKHKRKEIQNRINAFKETQIQLIESLKRNHKEFYAIKYDYPVSSIADIQSECGENENWILFAFSQNNIHLLSIRKEDVTYHKILFDKELEENIALVKGQLMEKSPALDFYEASHTIYTTLLGNLGLEKGMHLKIFPMGPVNGLPFEILCTSNEHSQRYMLEDYLISYHHSPYLSMYPHQKGKAKNNALLVAPDYSNFEEETLESLRGAQEEVSHISELIHSKVYSGEDASEQNFKETAGDYNILHLASHGFVDHKNPNYSKLVLSNSDKNEDGLLHSYEIYGLDLHADLVTLSACYTGTGKEEFGEGVSSLGRAFAFAGCPNSVMSLWSVNDQSTAKLMTYFYQNLKEGVPKAEALRAAKLEFLEKEPTPLRAPFYWAGFVYYGDNLPLEFAVFSYAGMLSWTCWLIGLFALFGLFHYLKGLKTS